MKTMEDFERFTAIWREQAYKYFHKHKELLQDKDVFVAYHRARSGEIRMHKNIFKKETHEELGRIFDRACDIEIEEDTDNRIESYKRAAMAWLELSKHEGFRNLPYIIY